LADIIGDRHERGLGIRPVSGLIGAGSHGHVAGDP
jgi:hypothetical protein